MLIRHYLVLVFACILLSQIICMECRDWRYYGAWYQHRKEATNRVLIENARTGTTTKQNTPVQYQDQRFHERPTSALGRHFGSSDIKTEKPSPTKTSATPPDKTDLYDNQTAPTPISPVNSAGMIKQPSADAERAETGTKSSASSTNTNQSSVAVVPAKSEVLTKLPRIRRTVETDEKSTNFRGEVYMGSAKQVSFYTMMNLSKHAFFSAEYQRDQSAITTIDFSGTPEICTDFLFYTLFVIAPQSKFRDQIKTLDCSGCEHLTDTGFELALRVFMLETIVIDCCTKITHKSLNLAAKKGRLNNVKYLSAKHTGIGVMTDRIENVFSYIREYTDLYGTPLQSTQLKYGAISRRTQTTFKVVIVRSRTEKGTILKTESASSDENLRYNGVFQYTKLNAGADVLNVYECSPAVAHLFIEYQSIVIISPECTVQEACIASCVSGAQYFLKDDKEFLDQLDSIKKKKADEGLAKLEEIRSAQTKLRWGEVCSVSALVSNLHEKRQASEGWTSKASGKINQVTLEKWWLLNQERINKEVFLLPDCVKDTQNVIPVHKRNCSVQLVNESAEGPNANPQVTNINVASDYFSLVGNHWRVPNSQWMIGDLTLFATIISSISTNTNKGDVAEGPMTQRLLPWMREDQLGVFYKADMEDMFLMLLEEKQSNVPQFIDCLIYDSGIIMPVQKAWHNDTVPCTVCMFPDLLDTDEPRELEDIWPELCRKEECQWLLEFDMSVPAAIAYRAVLPILVKLIAPHTAWSTGVLGHLGGADVRFSISSSNPYNLVLAVRGIELQNVKDRDAVGIWTHQEYLNTTFTLSSVFKLVRLCVQASLIQFGFGSVSNVACHYCKDKPHIFPTLLMIREDEKETTNARMCPTERNVIGAVEVGMDSHFIINCAHEKFLLHATQDKALRCSLCLRKARERPSEVTCKRCLMCMECIQVIKDWQSTQENFLPDIQLNYAAETKRIRKCNVCDTIFQGDRALQLHEKHWCTTESSTYTRQLNAGKDSAVKQVKLDSKHAGWKVGMRLEAVDRKTAGYICVANVIRVDGKQITVNFDGWNSSFDYTANSDHEDLHPPGYCAYIKHVLQPPKGMDKTTFEWSEYLSEIEQSPVPYESFNDKQRGECPPHAMYNPIDPLERVLHRTGSIYTMGSTPFVLSFALQAPAVDTLRIKGLHQLDSIYLRTKSGTTTQSYMSLAAMLKKTTYDEIVVRIKWMYDSACILFEYPDGEVREEGRIESIRPIGALHILFAKAGASAHISVDNSPNHSPALHMLKIGMAFEAGTQKKRLICSPATISAFDDEGKITFRQRVDPDKAAVETVSLWISDRLLHPPGYCAHAGRKMVSTNKFFDWSEELDKKNMDVMPMIFFDNSQTAGTLPIQKSGQAKIDVPAASGGWQVGMRLEAVDRANPSLTCVANVIDVNRREGKVKVNFDGWTSKYDYESETSTKDFHPIGYCQHVGIALQPPKGYKKKFDWLTYLMEISAVPVPFELFNRSQTQNCPKHPIYSGGDVDDDDEFESQEDEKMKTDTVLINMLLRTRNLVYNTLLDRDPRVALVPHDLPVKQDMLVTSRYDIQSWHRRKHVLSLLSINYNNNFLAHDVLAACGSTIPAFENVLDKPTYRSPMNMNETNSLILGPYQYTAQHKNFSIDEMSKLLEQLPEKKAQTDQVHIDRFLKLMRAPILDGHRNIIHGKINLPKKMIADALWGKDIHKTLVMEYLYRNATIMAETIAPLSLELGICPSCYSEECRSYCPALLKDLNRRGKKDDKEVDDRKKNINEQVDRCIFAKKEVATVQAWFAKDSQPAAPKTSLKLSDMLKLDKYEAVCELRLLTVRALQDCITTTYDAEPNLEKMVCASHLNVMMTKTLFTKITIKDLSVFRNMVMIYLKEVGLKDFSFVQPSWSRTLQKLDLEGNPFRKFPPEILRLRALRYLDLSRCGMEEISKNIGLLINLEQLYINHNLFRLHANLTALKSLPQLRHLALAAVPLPLPKEQTGMWEKLLTVKDLETMINKYFANMDEFDQLHKTIGSQAATPQTVIDTKEQQGAVTSCLRGHYFKRPQYLTMSLNSLRMMRILDISNQSTYQLSGHMASNCKRLQNINCSNSTSLVSIAAGFVNLRGCTAMRTPPTTVANRGNDAVIAYLRRLLSGFKHCKRTKLMFVGLGGAGKTSLVNALKSGQNKTQDPGKITITDGIDIAEWTVRIPVPDKPDVVINYSMWDFAGQSVYYNTHQFFLSDRAIYLLLWNSRLGFEHAGLDFWLSSVACNAPKAPVFVIGTHCDQVARSDLPMQELTATFKQIVGFFSVSTKTGEGIAELSNKLIEVTQAQAYMNEKVPTPFLNLEKDLLAKRKKTNVITLLDVQDLAVTHGLLDIHDVRQALTFLHDLGSIQYFQNEFLRDRIVINPQWLVDVMACLITVKESVIKEGRFNKEDISKIWAKYPTELHEWLLRLTEEFDLTYFVPSDKLFVVPCLLPEQEPNYDWPETKQGTQIRELKLTYLFDYLPTGLFNRAQSRLCEYSDSSTVWKKGSVLDKNSHLALIKQSRDKEIILKVQGIRPENILFLVHEVIESLIRDFFYGVKYDLSIPCIDCVTQNSQNPHMFSANDIARAQQLNAPVMQCTKSFHIVAIAALQEVLPPKTSNDFTQRLSGMMHDLDNLKKSVKFDVLLICEQQDAEDTDDTQVTPARLKADLVKDDLRVEIIGIGGSAKDHALSMTELSVALSSCCVALLLVTDRLCSDTQSAKVIGYVKQQAAVHFLPVIGKCPTLGKSWQKTTVGMVVSNEIYVDVRKPERYETRLAEIKRRSHEAQEKVSAALKESEQGRQKDVFISYCWSNSADAVKRGKMIVADGAATGADPRKVDEQLQKEGIEVWLDIRNMRQGALFEEICDGLRNARLVIAFVSDEYLRSDNCKNEFRFAAGVLKKPMILCPLGPGKEWQTSELAMLSLSAIRVTQGELVNTVKEHLQQIKKAEEEKQPKKTAQTTENVDRTKEATAVAAEPEKEKSYDAYAEMCELAQRNFSQQVAKTSAVIRAQDNELSAPYPRVVYIDVKPGLVEEAAAAAELKPDESQNASSRPTTPTTPVKGYANKRKITKGNAVDVLKQLQMTDFEIKFLCEVDGHWHIVGKTMPVPRLLEESTSSSTSVKPLTVIDFVSSIAAYESSILSILQHSDIKVNLFELTTEAGAILIQLKRLAEINTFEESFKMVWKTVRKADAKQTRNGLSRCALHSRRVVWLCQEHAKDARGTLSDDVLDSDDLAARGTAASTAQGSATEAQKKAVEAAQEEQKLLESSDGKQELSKKEKLKSEICVIS